jgi:hypothetical protein
MWREDNLALALRRHILEKGGWIRDPSLLEDIPVCNGSLAIVHACSQVQQDSVNLE